MFWNNAQRSRFADCPKYPIPQPSLSMIRMPCNLTNSRNPFEHMPKSLIGGRHTRAACRSTLRARAGRAAGCLQKSDKVLTAMALNDMQPMLASSCETASEAQARAFAAGIAVLVGLLSTCHFERSTATKLMVSSTQ